MAVGPSKNHSAAASLCSQGTGYRVLVEDLPRDTTRDEVMHVFSTYGWVNHIRMMQPGTSTGNLSAFVDYDSEDAVLDACELLDNVYSIHKDIKQPIRVKRWDSSAASTQSELPASGLVAQQECKENPPEFTPPPPPKLSKHKLFVGNLPLSVTHRQLSEVFGCYGKVDGVFLCRQPHASGFRAAFVSYDEEEDAQDAVAALNGVYRIYADAPIPMSVSWADRAEKLPSSSGCDVRRDSSGNHAWASREWRCSGSADSWRGSGWWQSGGWSGTSSWKDGWGGGQRGDRKRVSFGTGSSSSGCPQQSPEDDEGGGGQAQSSGQGGGPEARRELGCGSEGGLDDGNSMDSTATAAGAAVPNTSKCVHVYRNLPSSVGVKSLEDAFSTYGDVDKVRVEKDKACDGFAHAWVYYTTAYDAETCVLSVDGKYMIMEGYGHLRVKFANESRPGPY